MTHAPTDPLLDALSAHFGFSEFQRGQRAVIDSVMDGAPTLAVMPTGAGKSLCYQLPAVTLPGVTVVISPLISLMKDQVDALNERGVPAAYLNSSLSAGEQSKITASLRRGDIKLLYVAPERFQRDDFLQLMIELRPSLFAIDEAHCISQWGHDFRPDYALLGRYVAQIRPERLLACTATATPFVRQDILDTLGVPNAKVHVAGFLRPNLFLEAHLCGGEKEREQLLRAFLREQQEGALILYASTRKAVERYAQLCAAALGDEQVCFYHGGLNDSDRARQQERFMSGEARVVVATNAFGMGVDRGDVRAVVHVDLPRTVEAYYQEVGRAGRDRRPARCLLLYTLGDSMTHHHLIKQSYPTLELFERVWARLRGGGVSAEALEQELRSLKSGDVLSALRHLRRVGVAQIDTRSSLWGAAPDWAHVASVAQTPLRLDEIDRDRERELSMHDEMLRFAQSAGCRHSHLLAYFGEDRPERCPEGARCDRCAEGSLRREGFAEGEVSEDELRLARKALSGVARANGYYGGKKVVSMLVGSEKEAGQTFLRNLSTWGLLSHLGESACDELIKLLTAHGLCALDHTTRNGQRTDYKTLQMTPEGYAVMQGRAPLTCRLRAQWVSAERARERGVLPPALPPSAPPPSGAPSSAAPRAPRAPRASASAPASTSAGGGGGWRSAVKPKEGAAPSARGASRGGGAKPRRAGLAQAAGAEGYERDEGDEGYERDERDEWVSGDLAGALRSYRTERAREQQVPAYVVFSNEILDAFVARQPKSRDEFLQIKGVGPHKWANYGQDIIKIIRAHHQGDD